MKSDYCRAAIPAFLLLGIASVSFAGFFAATPPSSVANPEVTPVAEVEEHVARRTLRDSGFYDPDNPDRHLLQTHDSAIGHVPKDAIGFPDWMRALREGSITPRSGLKPGAAMQVLDLDIIMKNTKEMPFVRFPHNSHTLWLDCSNCHPKPFEPRAGSTKIAMADIFRGNYCGVCHDRVAFVTFFSCHRCHSVAQTPEKRPAP